MVYLKVSVLNLDLHSRRCELGCTLRVGLSLRLALLLCLLTAAEARDRAGGIQSKGGVEQSSYSPAWSTGGMEQQARPWFVALWPTSASS